MGLYGLLYQYDICFIASSYKALWAVTSHPTCTASGYMTGKSKCISKLDYWATAF